MFRRGMTLLLAAIAVSAVACSADQVKVGMQVDPAAEKTVAAHVLRAMTVAQGQDMEYVLDRLAKVVDSSGSKWMIIERSDLFRDRDGYQQAWFIFNDGSALRFFGSDGSEQESPSSTTSQAIQRGPLRLVGIEVTADGLK